LGKVLPRQGKGETERRGKKKRKNMSRMDSRYGDLQRRGYAVVEGGVVENPVGKKKGRYPRQVPWEKVF